MPSTYLGFPVEDSRDDCGLDAASGQAPATASPRRSDAGRRGVALLIAIMLISVMMTFSADLIITSHVSLQLASRQRDNMAAEYMAKSGLTMAEFLVSIDYGIDLFQASYMKTPVSDGAGDVWSLLNGMPIGSTSAELVESFKEGFGLSEVMDEGVLNTLKAFEGAFTIYVEDESNKINLNQCTNTANCRVLMKMLEGLFSCPIEQVFLEKKDLTPIKLAALIRDYVDKDSSATGESGYGEENAPYQKNEPRYEAKNAPLDSLEELAMVDGWDDDLHAVFSPYLTVYPVPPRAKDKVQINLNTASRELLSCLIPEARDLCAEKVAVGLYNREKNKENLVGGQVDQTLSDLLCYKGDDKDKKSDWFTQQSRVFAITAEGQVGDSLKRLQAVVERQIPDPAKAKPYEDGLAVYKLLSWKML